MGRAIYCPFPGCHVEYYTLCPKHQVIQPVLEKVAEHLDPDNILTRSIVYANLAPIVKLLEQQWLEIERLTRENKQLDRRVHSAENELQRLTAGS
jgi:hypothetical protein